jgi:pyroglutamyl-peptidase
MKKPTVLLTGFEPFGGDSLNPSWQVARALHNQTAAGARIVSLCLPTEFGRAREVLDAALRRQRPVLVLCLGLAASRSALSVERVAINVDDARVADNAGAQPIDQAVLPGAPAAYFSRLPIKAIVAALNTAGLPAEVSQTAGTFVCNHVFYGLMHSLRRRRSVRGGFMHVPPLATLPLHEQRRGVLLALATALQTDTDRAETGGSIA